MSQWHRYVYGPTRWTGGYFACSAEPAKVLACLRAHQIRDDHVEVCVRHWFIICIDQSCAGFWVSCPNPFRSLYHGPSDRSNHPDVKFVFTCRRGPCQGAWTLFDKQKRCANVCPGFFERKSRQTYDGNDPSVSE